jgi:hypothetical protein
MKRFVPGASLLAFLAENHLSDEEAQRGATILRLPAKPWIRPGTNENKSGPRSISNRHFSQVKHLIILEPNLQ